MVVCPPLIYRLVNSTVYIFTPSLSKAKKMNEWHHPIIFINYSKELCYSLVLYFLHYALIIVFYLTYKLISVTIPIFEKGLSSDSTIDDPYLSQLLYAN
jgi:hypothetical protein